MKRIIALFALFAFVAVVSGAAIAQDTRSPEQKLSSANAYLKTLDVKIIKYRKLGNTTMVNNLRAQKVTTIARMQVWKAERDGATLTPLPPIPVAPNLPPPPRPMLKKAAAAGMFGMGINTSASLGYIAGNSVMTARGDLVLGDALGIGPMLGLSEDAVAWKVGLGYGQGKDINNNEKKIIPLYFDGILNLPADMMGGIESYVGGGVNYVVYGSERKPGSYGVQAFGGIQGDFGLGGKSFVELGYSIVRSGTGVSQPYSMKGFGINFGTQIVL